MKEKLSAPSYQRHRQREQTGRAAEMQRFIGVKHFGFKPWRLQYVLVRRPAEPLMLNPQNGAAAHFREPPLKRTLAQNGWRAVSRLTETQRAADVNHRKVDRPPGLLLLKISE